MTKKEAAIVMAYTHDFFLEDEKIKRKAEPDFIKLCKRIDKVVSKWKRLNAIGAASISADIQKN